MDAAGIRQELQQAQGLAKELRALAPGASTAQAAFEKINQLARYVKRLREATMSLPASSRSMWEQRGQWLHEELIALTAERVQAQDKSGKNFWENVVQVLYAGAEEAERLTRSTGEAEERASNERRRAESLEARVASLEEQKAQSEEAAADAAAAAATVAPPSAPPTATASSQEHGKDPVTKETLELRTKVVVQQQEIQRRVADGRDLVQRLNAVLGERDALKKERDAAVEAKGRSDVSLERQAAVISQVMEQSEAMKKERDDLLASQGGLEAHNSTLSVNLANHAQVVEKLIELNTELMDTANFRAAMDAQAVTGVAGGGGGGGGSRPPPDHVVQLTTGGAGTEESLARSLERFMTDGEDGGGKKATAESLAAPPGGQGKGSLGDWLERGLTLAKTLAGGEGGAGSGGGFTADEAVHV